MIHAKQPLTKERKPSGKLNPHQLLKISSSTKSSGAKPEEQQKPQDVSHGKILCHLLTVEHPLKGLEHDK